VIEELVNKEIDNNREEYIEFLRELIQTESYNPPGNEKNVALKIEKYLRNGGITCEIFPFGENRANLIATLNNNFSEKNLLYNGHMDVVPPGSEEKWKFPPLSATLKRNKIFGRGATDMKGGLAAMIISLKILKKLHLISSGNLILNAVADEETGGKLGTEWCLKKIFFQKGIKSNFIIIGEPSQIDPIPSKVIFIGEKGELELKVISNGTSSHSWNPFTGKNAIYMMTDFIQNLDKLDEFLPKIESFLSVEKLIALFSVILPNKEIFERIYNEQPILKNILYSLTQLTESVNIIKGGIKSNVVPDYCEAIIDFRLVPGQTTDMIINGLTKLIDELGYQVKQNSKTKSEDVFFNLEIVDQSESSIWENWERSMTLKTFLLFKSWHFRCLFL